MSFVAAKIQQNCTGTGNYNSKATRQGIMYLCPLVIIIDLFAKKKTPQIEACISPKLQFDEFFSAHVIVQKICKKKLEKIFK